jgi:GTP pyrophosphokinase
MISSAEFLEKIRAYHPNLNESLIQKAYILSKTSHGNQKRHSGDAYFLHPLAVAEILIELKLDQETIITALLHDVAEDTDVTIDDIKKDFGEDIAKLVDGVTKLSKIENLSVKERFSENFRKLILAISEDIRVLLVKLADRLHNMQTLSYVPSQEKKLKKAKETIEIYAPLAARIGLNKIRDQLEDLSFSIIDPENRSYITEKLAEIKKSNNDIINNISQELTDLLNKNNLSFEVYGREKKPYSIYQKMLKKNIGFSNLHDVMAFRIITEEVNQCYQVLGIINTNYNMIPNSFKDYISTPKENGYQSIHLSILGPLNKKIEIQIRDKKMHEIADLGVAAHWSYKENAKSIAQESYQFRWIREFTSLVETSENSFELAKEIFSNNKFQIQKDKIFCFTPDGDIFNLPQGSNVIDFAYSIHSDIGNSCIGAKINGIEASLKQRLENGDQVEIITSKNAKPSFDWLQSITTSKAKYGIKNYIKKTRINEYSKLGKEILDKFFNAREIMLDESLLLNNIDKFNKKTLEDFYIKIAEGVISRNEVFKVLYPNLHENSSSINHKKDHNIQQNIRSIEFYSSSENIAVKFAECCSAIYGEPIIGINKSSTEITIHNQACLTWKNSNLEKDSLIDISWKYGENLGQNYIAKIIVIIDNKVGSLADILGLFAKKNINIDNLSIIDKSAEKISLQIDIEVKNIDHLNHILSSIKISEKIFDAKRII